MMMIEGPRDIEHLEVSSESDRLEAYVIADGSLTTWVWSLERGIARLLRRFECGPTHGTWSDSLTMGWDASRRLFAKGGPGKITRLWSLSAPSDAEPLVLRRGAVALYDSPFDSSERPVVGDSSDARSRPCGR